MTQAEAERIVAKLFAAFPFHMEHDELTLAVYIEQIAGLRDPEVALKATNELIRGERYLPSIAAFIERYELAKRVARPLVIEDMSTVVSEEQRQENLRQVRAMVERLAAGRRLAA